MAIEKAHLGTALIRMAKVLPKYAPNFNDKDVLSIWYGKLKDFPKDDLRAYFETLIATSYEFPPLAKVLHDLKTGSTQTHAEIGEEVAVRIEAAIRKFGAPNWDLAQEYIGELGCVVVESNGGWERVCDCEETDLISLRRQWREFAKILSQKAAEGKLDARPRLPQGPTNDVIKQLAQDLSTTEKKRPDQPFHNYGKPDARIEGEPTDTPF